MVTPGHKIWIYLELKLKQEEISQPFNSELINPLTSYTRSPAMIVGSRGIHIRRTYEHIHQSGVLTAAMNTTRTRWRRVKTLDQHQVGVNLQSHAQHQLWISTWHIFHEFHKIMPSLSYPVSLVNQNVILVNISHWRLHMAWIMSLMST